MADNVLIGERIKLIREEKGITQEELAKTLGLNKSTIQRYETAKIDKIKLPVIDAIASKLNVNPEWLTGKADVRTDYFNFDQTVEELNKEFKDREELLTAYLEKVYDSAQDRDLAHALILQLPRVNTKCLEALNYIVYELAGKEENMSDFEKAVQEELNNNI